VKLTEEGDDTLFSVEYFQFSQNDIVRQIHGLSVFHTYVMVLDVFSDFLVSEQKAVPKEWQDELHGLGQAIERQHDTLKAALPVEEASSPFRTD
jgi:hypothetical protein